MSTTAGDDKPADNLNPKPDGHQRTKSTGGKLPSLDQLVAKMKPDAQPAGSTDTPPRVSALGAPGSRLRLPTRPAAASSEPSPEPSAALTLPPTQKSTNVSTPSSAGIPLPATDSDDAYTNDFVQPEPVVLNHMSQLPARPPRGYKNVPSLEAISSRLAALRSRERSVDPPAARPAVKDAYAMGALEDALEQSVSDDANGEDESEGADDEGEDGEIVEEEAPADDPFAGMTPEERRAARRATEHPLQNTWTWYYDSKPAHGITPTSTIDSHQRTISGESSYEAGLSVIGTFDTVEEFCRYWNWVKKPSGIERGSNYHMFKEGIKPMWEDPANTNGGKWVLTMRNAPELLDRTWMYLVFALVGNTLDYDDEVTGCVVSLRSRIDRIQLWTRDRTNVERINALGKRMVKELEVGDQLGIQFEYQYHGEDWPDHSKFISINTSTAPSARRDAPFSPTPDATPRTGWRGATAGSGGPAPVRLNLFGPQRTE